MRLSLVYFILVVCTSCGHNKRHASLSFEFIPQSKSELKENGFEYMVVKHGQSELTRKHRLPEETIFEDVLQKNIQDTFIQFDYEEDRLLSKTIYFSRKKFDSAKLFQYFISRGLRIIPSQANPVYEVVDENKKWHYQVQYNRREIRLYLELAKRKNPVPPPADVEVASIDSSHIKPIKE